MTAPQPSRKAREMTFRFVPGGPDPMTNGFGNFRPSTVVASVDMVPPFFWETSCLALPRQEFDRIFVAGGGARPPTPKPGCAPTPPPFFLRPRPVLSPAP